MTSKTTDIQIIKPNNLAATPNDMESLMDWCEAHTGSEKTVALIAATMGWNLACKLVVERQKNQEKNEDG